MYNCPPHPLTWPPRAQSTSLSLHPVWLWPQRFSPVRVSVASTGVTYPTCFKFWLWDAHWECPPISLKLCASLFRTSLVKQIEFNFRSQAITSPRATVSKEQEKFGKIPFDYASFDAQVFGKCPLVQTGRKTPPFPECKLEFQYLSPKMYLVYVCVMGGDAFK